MVRAIPILGAVLGMLAAPAYLVAQAPQSSPVVQERLAALEAAVNSLRTELAASQASVEALRQALSAEAAARQSGDAEMRLALESEEVARHEADARLSDQLADGLVPGLPSCLAVAGDDVLFEGCNVHVRNGAGRTDARNGLGNLVIGYNEDRDASSPPAERDGSHNLVIGPKHQYRGTGGFVAGHTNSISGPSTSVLGGHRNSAIGSYSAVVAGVENVAEGTYSTVVAGHRNEAKAFGAAILGGGLNAATGAYSAIAGGQDNKTTAGYATLTGGIRNLVGGPNASISGGADLTLFVSSGWRGGEYQSPPAP